MLGCLQDSVQVNALEALLAVMLLGHQPHQMKMLLQTPQVSGQVHLQLPC